MVSSIMNETGGRDRCWDINMSMGKCRDNERQRGR